MNYTVENNAEEIIQSNLALWTSSPISSCLSLLPRKSLLYNFVSNSLSNFTTEFVSATFATSAFQIVQVNLVKKVSLNYFANYIKLVSLGTRFCSEQTMLLFDQLIQKPIVFNCLFIWNNSTWTSYLNSNCLYFYHASWNWNPSSIWKTPTNHSFQHPCFLTNNMVSQLTHFLFIRCSISSASTSN